MRKISSNDQLMTTKEVGEVLGVALRTVQLWVESGVLPAWRTAGGHRRIARSAVDQLLSQRNMAVAQTPAKTSPGNPGRPLKVLIVDDNPEFIMMFSMMVEAWDFPVELTGATDGFEGLMKVGHWEPDLVITDLNMPGIDGFRMIRSLKKSESRAYAPTLLVTSALSSEEIGRRGGLPEGVTFFQKPVPFAKIEAMARQLQTKLPSNSKS